MREKRILASDFIIKTTILGLEHILFLVGEGGDEFLVNGEVQSEVGSTEESRRLSEGGSEASPKEFEISSLPSLLLTPLAPPDDLRSSCRPHLESMEGNLRDRSGIQHVEVFAL